ncbi:hypothetical protein DOTSEDRAFT_68546 [Dothistroma septosporum NZE10]|uniref:Yeast cell wall synthesis Kre9/Knh1-like N-terminal domain-containing protein n=1 Tax=Dothistroma septosporum (strain NZE10 / CBS 128990) TaxID=675120 RepID=N1Q261_DOTSN|nr:hypothetical protein DOTSEDRAFT_68546 [Dothistroma septosporum NZE10]
MFAKALLVGVLAAVAAAQSSTLSFTRVPSPVTAGQEEALTYATGDTNSPVTILLRKGDSGNLQTVATLTSTATDGQYLWTVDKSLPNGSDYALEIKQGDQTNYFGPFQIQGGGQASSSSSSSASSSGASAAGYMSGASAAIATVTASKNSSAITTATISAGTGYSMPRNQTMSSATLTRPSSQSATQSANETAGTSGAGFQGSQTSSAAPAYTGAASSLVAIGSSAVALACGAVAALFFY